LDDWRRPCLDEGYILADNYATFLELLDKYRDCLELVDLDYDLGYDSLFSGFDALKYMKKHDIKPDHINIHSTHAFGREKMLRYAAINFPDSVITGWSKTI
jgi:hypothetical protein